jgi:hypothetical protein
MIANEANVPQIAAYRLPMTGDLLGSTTDVAEAKNAQNPKTAIRAPITAI